MLCEKSSLKSPISFEMQTFRKPHVPQLEVETTTRNYSDGKGAETLHASAGIKARSLEMVMQRKIE